MHPCILLLSIDSWGKIAEHFRFLLCLSCKPHDPWTAFCLIHSLFASLECILIFTGSDSIFGFVNAFRVKKKTSVNNSHNVRKPFFKISKAYKAKAAVFKFLVCCCWVDALKWEIISFLIFPSCT